MYIHELFINGSLNFMRSRVALVVLLVTASLILAGCFASTPRVGELKGYIQEDPARDVTKLSVSFAGKEVQPTSAGAFSFPDISYGTYELVVSEDGDDLYSQPVNV